MSHVSLPCTHCSQVHRAAKEFSKLCHSHMSWRTHARDISQYVAVVCSVLQCTLVDIADASCHTYESVTRAWLHHIFESSHVCGYHIERKHTVYNRLLPPLQIPPPYLSNVQLSTPQCGSRAVSLSISLSLLFALAVTLFLVLSSASHSLPCWNQLGLRCERKCTNTCAYKQIYIRAWKYVYIYTCMCIYLIYQHAKDLHLLKPSSIRIKIRKFFKSSSRPWRSPRPCHHRWSSCCLSERIKRIY